MSRKSGTEKKVEMLTDNQACRHSNAALKRSLSNVYIKTIRT